MFIYFFQCALNIFKLHKIAYMYFDINYFVFDNLIYKKSYIYKEKFSFNFSFYCILLNIKLCQHQVFFLSFFPIIPYIIFLNFDF